MVLNDVSVLDHAVLDSNGHIRGGCYIVKALVSGPVCPIENVVVDFSSIKKKMKKLIDDTARGYDHKLLILGDYSNCEIVQEVEKPKLSEEKINRAMQELKYRQYDSPTHMQVTSQHIDFTMPRDCVTYVPSVELGEEVDENEAIRLQIENGLQNLLQHNLGFMELANITGLDIKLVLEEEPRLFDPSNMHKMFRYAHGLKNSTSYGCQNPSHGHLSYIEFLGVDADDEVKLSDIAEEQLEKVLKEFDNKYYINAENVDEEWIRLGNPNVHFSYISYRSTFKLLYKGVDKFKVFDTETTIEHLADAVADEIRSYSKLHEELQKLGCDKIMVSEGLSKGAMANL